MNRSYPHEVLAVLLQVRADRLHVLLWRRAIKPFAGAWALPGGRLGDNETLEASVDRHLAAKVDVTTVGHLEQLATRSNPRRVPGERVIATGFLGVVPADVEPRLPDDTTWHAVERLPRAAFDHNEFILTARERLRAKLSYTNIAFALAPATFTISELRDLYNSALGHEVSATNLQRVLLRREVIEPTSGLAPPGPSGGRPATVFRFRTQQLVVTDPAAIFRRN